MKKLFFYPILAVLFLAACQKDNDQLSDEDLIQQLISSSEKTAVAVSDLPEAAQLFIEENHFETYIEEAYTLERRGFEIVLGDDNRVYCDQRGRILRSRRNQQLGHGPCGHGESIRPSELPASVTDYVAENYPDATIRRAKQLLNGSYFVKIDDPNYILIFDADGNFVEATVLFYQCRPLGTPFDIATLPEEITGYITDNFPGAEIKVAFQKNNGMFIVGIVTADGRKIVGFDEAGNFLFVRP